MTHTPLNLFYSEPDPDRWIKYDRYPRRVIRRIIHGKPRMGGVMTIAYSLMAGLDKIGVPYRFNDYSYIKKHPEEIACIIGKPHVLFEKKWANPVILGAGVYSHPVDEPQLFSKYPNVKRFLVPGEWMKQMCEPYYGNKVVAWPAGIDTDKWRHSLNVKTTDFLIYDKIRWNYQQEKAALLDPVLDSLSKKHLSYHYIKYGSYTHKDLVDKLESCKAVIFLCEHETQGLAYQQILATGTPILAWDRGGYWQDPAYFPQVTYAPVSSVPYWDDRCGIKFKGIEDFEAKLSDFLYQFGCFDPRAFIMENLTLECSAEKYLAIHNQVLQELTK